MEQLECETFWARVYMAGNIENAKNTCRKFCQSGFCINIYETDYIYNSGEEIGFCVELINYPRFPETDGVILDTAKDIDNQLLVDCFQVSYMIVTSNKTYWHSRKDELRR